jgi:Flp pilus assembly protein TadG
MRRPGFAIWKSERGATMVEFALVTILLMMVLLSVIEMSRMIMVYTTVANAARAGARYAMVHGGDRPTTGVAAIDQQSPASCAPSSCTQIQAVVRNYASAGLLNANNVVVAVSFPDTTNKVGSRVQVTATYTYNPLVGYFSTILNKSLSSRSQGIIVF